jgi:hypothetical protein
MDSEVARHDIRALSVVLLGLIAAAAYLPILDNGFIADDYVILTRIEILKAQPLYINQLTPENFRLVSYFVFGILKALAAYQAWVFYAFNVGLHVVNVILLWRLLRLLIGDDLTARLAALLFAVFQAPQEAVMWLAAMNETTLFFFAVVTLISWLQRRYTLAASAYSFALISKESAIIIPILVLLLDWYKEQRFAWRRYLWLLIPSVAFLALFFWTSSNNFMLTNRSYAFGGQALSVIALSIHRLVWPWFYIMFAVAWLKMRRMPSLPVVGAYGCGIIVTMLPYSFIAYQASIPSRQLYITSAVLMTMFAVLLKPLQRTLLLKMTVAAFVAFNVGYLWWRKDGQFEDRAAPTTQLIQVLRRERPQKTVIKKFAYPFPEIASGTALAVPGWDPSLISADRQGDRCEDCLELEWDEYHRRYDTQKR